MTPITASPRPTRYVLRSQAISPCRDSDPDCRGTDFGEVDVAEIALVEHHTLGSQSAQVVVTETMTDVFAFDPDCFGVVRAVSRAAV
jgi:hypothetical protein